MAIDGDLLNARSDAEASGGETWLVAQVEANATRFAWDQNPLLTRRVAARRVLGSSGVQRVSFASD